VSDLIERANLTIDGDVMLSVSMAENGIELWSGKFDPSSETAMEACAKAIHNKNPGLKVEVILSRLRAIVASDLELIDEHGRHWSKPSELPSSLPDVMPYDSELLPESIGAAVNDVAKRMGCPTDYPAAAVLVAMAAVVGNIIGIRPKQNDNWLVIPNLWGCIIGRPSAKKSPSALFAEKLIRGLEAKERAKLEKEIAKLKSQMIVNKIKAGELERKMKDSFRDGRPTMTEEQRLETAKEMRACDLEIPVPRRIITSDCTIEKLIDLLGIHPQGMLLWVDELVSWLRSLDKDSNADVRPKYLTLWNGQGVLNIDRMGRGETTCNTPCLSLFGCATPGGISAYVSDAVKGGRGDDGLLQRLQIAVWPDLMETDDIVDIQPDSVAMKRAKAVFERLAEIQPLVLRDPMCGEDEKYPWVRFDCNAQQVFNQWWQSKQIRSRADGASEAFESHLVKYDSMVPSIALILHLCDGGEGSVGVEATKRAVRWAEYLESHARRVYAIAASPERQTALPLLRRLVQWDRKKVIRLNSIRKKGWSGLTTDAGIEAALDCLEDCGWVQSHKSERTEKGGRPTKDYFLHPEAGKILGEHENSTTKTPKTPSMRELKDGAEVGFGGFDGAISKKSNRKLPVRE